MRQREGVSHSQHQRLSSASVIDAPALGSQFSLPFLHFSALPSVKRHRNGRAGVKEPKFAPFSTLREPMWQPFQGCRASSPIAIDESRNTKKHKIIRWLTTSYFCEAKRDVEESANQQVFIPSIHNM
jgi:hypothetical protein